MTDTTPAEFSASDTITALRQTLALAEAVYGKAQQGYFSGEGWAARCLRAHLLELQARAASQPSKLTAQQLDALIERHCGGTELTDGEYSSMVMFAASVERAHGIGASQPAQEPVTWPKGLRDRLRAAHERFINGHAPRRIPADPTDADLVLAEVRNLLDGDEPPFWVAGLPREPLYAAPLADDEAVRLLIDAKLCFEDRGESTARMMVARINAYLAKVGKC